MKLSFPVDKYIWVLNLALLALLGWALAQVTSTGIQSHFSRPGKIAPWKPPAPSDVSAEKTYPISIKNIEARNILKAEIPEEEVSTGPEGGDIVSIEPLNVELEGIARGPGWAFATILDNDSKEKLVLAVGDEVQSGWCVVSIGAQIVKVRRENGAVEELEIDFKNKKSKKKKRTPRTPSRRVPSRSDYSKIVKKLSDTEYAIDKEGFDAALENMNELVTHMRMVPNFTKDRQVDGFRVMRLRRRSIFYELGLRNGDVIQTVNGVVLDDARKGMELLQMLKDQNRFTIDLKRNNQKMTFTYDVR